MTSAQRQGLLTAIEASFAEAMRVPEGTAMPVALLWTDADTQWQPIIPRLRALVPHIYCLGDYRSQEQTGPAIWLRCIVDRTLPDVSLPADTIPVLYLPGVSRQVLRTAEDCPREYQPLVELQYRGRVWHQRNGRDWTLEAFLVGADGLGLDLAQDAQTKDALKRALPLLAELSLDGLRGRKLDADDFDRLAVADPTRDLLLWMGAGDAFRTGDGEGKWRSFCSLCKTEFGFDPDAKTPTDAAASVIVGGGAWDRVWQRFREAPRLYPGVSKLLREAKGQFSLDHDRERIPSVNDSAEEQLRKALQNVAAAPQAKAIETIAALEREHAPRRAWVWAQLGESPLAMALEPLARLASFAGTTLGGSTLQAAAAAYAADGWKCDRAAVDALTSVRAPQDVTLIEGVVKAVYEPWLDASARSFQVLWTAAGAAPRDLVAGTASEKDTCLVFADGLRFDLAGWLGDLLAERGYRVRHGHRLSPLPTVTATAKPFATIVHDALAGGDDEVDFNPAFKDGGQACNAERLRTAMAKRGLDILGDDTRPPHPGSTGGWVEVGHIDELGHKIGARLPAHLESELLAIVDRIAGLFEAGWLRVRVVTDHGWLLLPGGLPRIELPTFLTATKWARCATVKGASQPSVPIVPWHWNSEVRIASPHGIGVFTPNTSYAHGGISPQECVVPELTVERGDQAPRAKIAEVAWRGMRCRVRVETNDPTVVVDLRLNWKQADTSIAVSAKEVGPAGEASLAVADDTHEGAAATVVLLDPGGAVLDRTATTVGEAT